MDNMYSATGKRKRAIARVIIKSGKGNRIINGQPMKEFLKSDSLLREVEQPFDALKAGASFDLVAKVHGGGLSGQAGAVRLGASRSLGMVSEDYRKTLRKGGFLTRDSRVVERKKYGRAGARKRFQFSKR